MATKRTRKIRITATRHLRWQRQLVTVSTYCPACSGEVGTLSVAEAAEFLEVEELALHQFIAEGHLHSILTISGSLRVCQNSLFCKESQL